MNKYSMKGTDLFDNIQYIETWLSYAMLGILGSFDEFNTVKHTEWTDTIMFLRFLWDNIYQLPWKPPSLCKTSIWYSLYSDCSQHTVIIATWHPVWNNNGAGVLGECALFLFFFASSHVKLHTLLICWVLSLSSQSTLWLGVNIRIAVLQQRETRRHVFYW